MDIDKAINNSGVADKLNPWQGDCREIAIAIQNVFGGKLKALSTVEEKGYQDHVFVKIGRSPYDGKGKNRYADLYDEFISYGTGDIDDYICDVSREEIKENNLYSDDVRESAEQLLTTAKDDLKSSSPLDI